MIKLIQERLALYNAANQLEEEYAVKEILQDIAASRYLNFVSSI